MARVKKKSPAKKSASSKKSAAKKSAARRPAAGKARRKSTSSGVTARMRMKDTAMKVLAGATSGAVQALIPSLEEAAGRGAKSAGTDKAAGQQRPTPRK